MEHHLTFIDQSVWTTDLCVGGTGGYPFLLVAQHPFTVKVMKFYRDDCSITGIYVENWDGTTLKVGAFWDEHPITVEFDKEERLINVWLYSSKKDDQGRFAGWRCKTNKKENFECFAKHYSPMDDDRVEVPVGTGMLCGIFGKGAAEIDCFGLAMKKH